MGLFSALRDRRKARKRRKAREDIFDALDEARRTAPTREITVNERLVIFSDHHKGSRDGADDFQRCERAYNAALTYYNFLGWHLVELGDVDELWENTFAEVASSYPQTMRLAADFHAQGSGRYTRLYGNHDLAWTDAELFADCMTEHGYGGITPLGSLRLAVGDGEGRRLGELLLVHGHQGTADSDRHARRSKFFVRRGWRPLQRLLNRPWNTPSVDWDLRGEHASTMATWAQDRRQVLIAGHTHLPVFFNQRKTPEPPPEAMAPDEGTDPQVAEALRRARAAWAEAEAVWLANQQPVPLATPCYFNTGCCSFGDGDITGIEIADGEIRLVRWPADPDTDRRQLGTPLRLEDVFERVASHEPAAVG
jgi:hypothetical protein